MIFLKFSKAVLWEVITWYKVKASGLFDAASYRLQNPDIGPFPPLLHWVRFGFKEGRKYSYDPLASWLLPLLIDNTLGLGDIRRLVSSVDNIEDLAFEASKVDINVSDYEYLRLIHICLLYTSPSPRDLSTSRMPSSA